MKDCIKFKSLFPEALYRELNEYDMKWFMEHLKICSRCAAEYEESSSTLNVMDDRILPDPGEEYFEGYWERLESKLESKPKPEPRIFEFWNDFKHSVIFRPRLLLTPAAAVLVLIAGILVGSRFSAVETPLITQNEVQMASVSPFQFNSQIESYLERSKIILSSFANFDPDEEDIYGLDLPGQRKISSELLNEARFIRTNLANQQQHELLDLVLDLQMILKKISRFENERGLAEIKILQSEIEDNSLIFKINLEELSRAKTDQNDIFSRDTKNNGSTP
jgi:hypothetical protein